MRKHANHKQTPREPEMPFKTLVDKIDQLDLTRTITNNHKRLYKVNQTTTNISEDLKQMNVACNNINDLNQNDLEQFERTICNVLNGINNTYDRKHFKGRPKFALFCSYCSSHGHTKGRCFKRPRRESIARPKERPFYSHMRNNQNLLNRRIDSNNINERCYHQHHQYTTIPEAEHDTDHNQETILIKTHIAETIDTIKDIAIRIIIITIEAEAIIETIITGVELTVTTETIIITNTTIADQAQDTKTAVTQDNIHRTTKIIIIITITIIDKDIIVKIQTKVIDTDNDQVLTIDIVLIKIIIIGMTEENQGKENKMINIIQKIEEQTEINTTITIKTE